MCFAMCFAFLSPVNRRGTTRRSRGIAQKRATPYDFTADQFLMPDYSHDVKYEDILSNVEEAKSETMSGQVDELRRAFRKAFNEGNTG